MYNKELKGYNKELKVNNKELNKLNNKELKVNKNKFKKTKEIKKDKFKNKSRIETINKKKENENKKKIKYLEKRLKNKNNKLINKEKHNKLRKTSIIILKNRNLSLHNRYLIQIFSKYTNLFYEYVKNKTVAIVGPAESIKNNIKGNIIDQFDIVIRLNKALPLSKNIIKYTGKKTDIIYNSLNTTDFPGQNILNTKLFKKYGVKFVVSPYPYSGVFKSDIDYYINRYKFDIPFRCPNKTMYRKFINSLMTRPYTGTSAIWDILNFPIKMLYITGIDFYNTPYYSQYRKIRKSTLRSLRNNNIHKAYPQMEYLLYKSLNDNRIILDNTLENLLYINYKKIYNFLINLDINLIFNNKDIIDLFNLVDNFIYIKNKNIKNFKNFKFIFNLINNNSIIISCDNDVIFNLNLNTHINKKLIYSLNKYIKLLDIKKLHNDILFLFILICVFKNNININKLDIDYNKRYKDLLLLRYLQKNNIINFI